ncbi:MAG: hypothetical protein KAH17_04325, partial [Bacteroidales bacterium]|nr:hypothetical protein [Bacteroidales bacterium]
GEDELNYRLRFLLRTSDCDMSFLRQKDHQTMGIKVEPVREHLKIVIGDFQYDQGLGMLFSTRRSFRSWSQNPHLHLYRARGLKVNTSSDTSRFLRGGGVSYAWNNLELTGLFSDRSLQALNTVDGLFLNMKNDRIHAGLGIVGIQYLADSYRRYGGHLKYLLPGAIVFVEVAAVNPGGQALEAGISFFGDDQHQFIMLYRMGSPGYYQRFTTMDVNQNLFVDKKVLNFNYLWEWRNGWFFQLDAESYESFGLLKGSLSPGGDWKIRAGIKRDNWDEHILNVKSGLDHEGLKSLFRYRHILDQQGSYLQSEIGYSYAIREGRQSKHNSYLGIDWAYYSEDSKFILKSGFCVHRGQSGGILLYRYEPDMYYQMSLPVISGSGFRGYVAGKITLTNSLQLEFKLNRTVYADRDKDPIRSQVKVQMVYRPSFVLVK